MRSKANHLRSRVAIIGGGPAGASLAARVAAAGPAVTLIEAQPGWEKPCGGGITAKALQQFTDLSDIDYTRNRVRECEIVSPRGRRLVLALDREIAIFARSDLNRLWLDRARQAGATLVTDRVVRCEAEAEGWRLFRRDGDAIQAEMVINASGARNRLPAPLSSPLGAGEWMATAGYFVPAAAVPWPSERMVIRFLEGIEGYIWSFPRADHASIGICGRIGTASTADLRRRLETWMDENGIERSGARFYAHLLPAPDPKTLSNTHFAGTVPHSWALAGDAAGLVDPITGEGLYYALRSAELLGDAIVSSADLNDAPARYQASLKRDILPELIAAGGLTGRFYQGRFLGDSVLERMTQFGQRSPRFRQLLCDLFAGSQGYVELRQRLYRNLVPSLVEIATASSS